VSLEFHFSDTKVFDGDSEARYLVLYQHMYLFYLFPLLVNRCANAVRLFGQAVSC